MEILSKQCNDLIYLKSRTSQYLLIQLLFLQSLSDQYLELFSIMKSYQNRRFDFLEYMVIYIYNNIPR
jgi:hypothetical protein